MLVEIGRNNSCFIRKEISHSGLNATMLDPSHVSAAILNSFSNNKTAMGVLSNDARKYLEDLGLTVCHDLFVSSSQSLRWNAIKEFLPGMSEQGYQWILRKCPSLLEDELNLGDKLFLKHFINSDVIHELMTLLMVSSGPNASCHLRILSKLTDTILTSIIDWKNIMPPQYHASTSEPLRIETSITGVVKWDDMMPSDFFQRSSFFRECYAKDEPETSAAVNDHEVNSIYVKDEPDTSAAVNDYEVNSILTIKKLGNRKIVKLDKTFRLSNPRFYQIQFNGGYPFKVHYLFGRFIVKEPLESGARFGSIIVAINGHVLPLESCDKLRRKLKDAIKYLSRRSPVVTFVEDSEFTDLLTNVILPHSHKNTNAEHLGEQKE